MLRGLLLSLGLSFSLGACAFVDFRTAERLSQLSPLNTDPSGVAVYLDLPDGLQVLPGSAVLTFGAVRTDTGVEDFVYYTLEDIQADDLRGFRVAKEDHPMFRGQQLRLRAWEAAYPDATNGTFSVNAEFCTIDGGPAPGALASVFVQYEEGGTLNPLFIDAPVTRVFDASNIVTMPPCSG
mgnify:CR=1 FL=1